MPLTEKIDFPSAPGVQKEKWTSRVMFAFEKTVTKMVEMFSPLQGMLAFGILLSGVDEIVNGGLSLGWFIIVIFLLISNILIEFKKVSKEEIMK